VLHRLAVRPVQLHPQQKTRRDAFAGLALTQFCFSGALSLAFACQTLFPYYQWKLLVPRRAACDRIIRSRSGVEDILRNAMTEGRIRRDGRHDYFILTPVAGFGGGDFWRILNRS
jgi:hypothetical protein